jgi:hypothetical protein
MDAKLVWRTWRRILKDDRLVEWLRHPKNRGAGASMGLTAEEIKILVEYANTPLATDTNIGMYRRGLVRNALAALSLVPLAHRQLYMSGLDVEAVAADFVLSTGYRDDGPNFWRIAGGFVAHLARLPEFAGRLQQDLLALDVAAVALARRLGESAPPVWPESAASIFLDFSATPPRLGRESTRFVVSRAAVAVSSSYDLTTWLEGSEEFDADEKIEPSKRHWLVYFPAVDAPRAYAELSEPTARVFNLLSTPKTASEVSTALNGLPSTEKIDSLAELGVVVREQDA